MPRYLVLPLAAALLSVGLGIPPAQASEPQLTAVLTLAGQPGDAERLHRLAAQRPVRGALKALAPAARHRDAALRFATQHRLRVVRSDAWSITVTAGASALARTFGGTLHHTGAGTWAEGAAVPAALQQDVAAVVGLDNRRLHRAHATRDGTPNPQTPTSLREAYDVPTNWRGAGVTVGILNLAGWDRNDLDIFAGFDVPTSQVEEINVGLEPTAFDGFGSEYEVALDSEAVLGMAPEAKQRLYFAPNTSAGVVSAFQKMATDAENGLLQVVTTSWGSCEKLFDQLVSEADQDAYQAGIDRLVAAGATLFAASGDAGAFDCATPREPDHEAQVDFPASYPNTVAVGGTTLTAGQPETGWHDQGVGDYLGDGSGGGESVEQPLPSYQAFTGAARRLVPDVAADADPQSGLRIYVGSAGGWSTAGGTSLAAPLWAGMLASALSSRGRATGLGNILPALYASASDPNTPGLRDITEGHNGLFSAGPGYDQVTGLGVPTWPDLAKDLLASAPGVPTVGTRSFVPRPAPSPDPVLQAGYTNQLTAAVRVIAPAGYTGFSVGETVPACARQQSTPPTTALLDPNPWQGEHQLTLTAFDTGHVCHLVRAAVVYDTVPPTSTTMTAERVNNTDTQTRLRLGGRDATSGIGSFEVTAKNSAGQVVFHTVTASTAPVIRVFARGQRYVVTSVARDRAGNPGPTATVVVTLAHDDTAYKRSGSWTRHARALDYAGSHLASPQAGATATITATTRRIDLLLLKGPKQGYTDVYVDGRRIARWDLYAPTTTAFRPLVGNWTSVGVHTVKLVNVGRHRPASGGSYLILDGVLVLT